MVVNLAQSSASLAAQDTPTLKQALSGITAESCPRAFNFHMHTLCSDGLLPPEKLMEQAIAIGLQGLAITDHHTTQGYQAAQRWLDGWQQQHPTQSAPKLWVGVEINANLLETEVHILGYAFNPQHAVITPYLHRKAPTGHAYEAAMVISSIQQAGGIAVLAHPARYRRSPSDLIPEAARLGINGVETYYAYNNPSPWQSSPEQTKLVHRLGEEHGLLHTCGTDTHGMSLLKRL